MNDLATTVAEQVTARTEVELEVFRVLTPEQRARVRALRDEHLGGRAGAGRRAGGPSPLLDDEDSQDAPGQSAATSAPLPEGSQDDAPADVRPLRALDLTPEQWSRVRELRRRFGPLVRALGPNLRETRRALADALLADEIDASRVKELGVTLGRHEADRVRLRFDIEAGIVSILTPEQARQYRERRRHRRQRTSAERPPAPALDRP
jgi:Spy/CpxP family protein refolding chaperone